MSEKKLVGMLARYILIFILGLGNLALFYFLFTKPTILMSNFLLNIISPTELIGSTILFKNTLVTLIPACIAGAAYYLLLILALSVPNLKITKRISLLGFLFASLFIFNTLRITLFSLITKVNLFNELHLLFWYFISTVFIVILWFIAVRIFKIKDIPIYSDFKFLVSNIRRKSKVRKRKL